MSNPLPDLSNKISREDLEIIQIVTRASVLRQIPLTLIGAKASEFLLSGCFGIQSNRPTSDLDFAGSFRSWSEYEALCSSLEEQGLHRKPGVEHRFHSSSGGIVDIVPFGALEHPPGQVGWPPDGTPVLKVIGFADAVATEQLVSLGPQIEVRIIGLAGFAALKLLAWSDRQNEKDVQDFGLVLKNYLEAGNEERLYGGDASDLLEEDDFDLLIASARLLGRDLKNLASQPLLSVLTDVINQAIALAPDARFISTLSRMSPQHRISEDEALILKCLNSCLRGLQGR
jgi:predicted nucleotidyltransferase